MPISSFRSGRASRIDDDNTAAVALGAPQERHEVWRRADGVVAPNYKQLAMSHVAIRLRPPLAQRCFDSTLGCRSTNAALELAGAEAVPQSSTGHRHLHQAKCPAIA